MRPSLEPSSSGPDRPSPAGAPGGYERPPLDLARVPTPARVIVGAGLVYLLVLLLPWNRFCLPRGCVVATGVAGVGVLCFLLVVALLVWELAPLLGRRWGLGAAELYVTFGLTGGLFLFTVIRVAVRPDRLPRSLFAWIGLILTVGMGVGAYLRVMRTSASAPGSGLDGSPPPLPPLPVDPQAPTAPLEPPVGQVSGVGAPGAVETAVVGSAPTRVEPPPAAAPEPPATEPAGVAAPEGAAAVDPGPAPASEPVATGALAVEPTTELPTPPEPGEEPDGPPPSVIDAPRPSAPSAAVGRAGRGGRGGRAARRRSAATSAAR